jgi:precorrin-8X/cobalt-precorrin-8 methylmutase
MINYLKDPQAIYARSFETIREEADLSSVPQALQAIALRLIHACGMTDIVDDLRGDETAAQAVCTALAAGKPVLIDCEMAGAAIIRRTLPAATEVICTLNDPRTEALAGEMGTTRSAAAVALWAERLDGAVVVIGNAPTALFALLERLDAGGPRPAAILAFPVGFVGAAESKAELAGNPRGIPFVTLLGRRGGSAMAGAALNAITAGAQ